MSQDKRPYQNQSERCAEDASEDIAREIMRRLDIAGHELPSSLERHLGHRKGCSRYGWRKSRLIAS